MNTNTGQVIYSTYLGSSGYDYGNDIAADSAGAGLRNRQSR
jgi:hypothetical protein